jgi:GAF domain-containing protein
VAGLAFARGKPLVIDDVEADERFAGRVPRDRYASRALAVVPVGGAGEPLGVLCATDREGGAGFGDDELGPLRILALQAAQLLARRGAGGERPTPERSDSGDAELARRVCEALTREVEPARLLAAALAPVAGALCAAPVSVHLIDNASGELVVESQHGAETRPDRPRLPRDRGLTASVLQTGRLVASDHPETDPRFDPEIDTPENGDVGPLVCVPLRLRGKCLGVLRAFPRETGRASARTAEVVSAALSAAIRNVLLYRSLLESIDEVAAVRRETGSGT